MDLCVRFHRGYVLLCVEVDTAGALVYSGAGAVGLGVVGPLDSWLSL
jgi:hypothetical protein